MLHGDYSLVNEVPENVEEIVWVGKKCVGPRLRSDELWLMYRLVDNRCWLVRRRSPPFAWDFSLHLPYFLIRCRRKQACMLS